MVGYFIYMLKWLYPAYFYENLYLYIFSYYHLFGLMVILVHTFITYLTYLWNI